MLLFSMNVKYYLRLFFKRFKLIPYKAGGTGIRRLHQLFKSGQK